MKKAMSFRLVFVLVAMIALGWLPQPVLAQRGGHGGGGGFHSGGGGGGFHSGGGGVGFHGSGGFYAGGHSGYGGGHYSGYRGGYYAGRGYYGGRGYYRGRGGYGWGGRYWGRGYGYGWGWGFGFGWPYWGWGYPYGYYYNPWYYVPNPYYSYRYYPDPNNGDGDPPPADPNAPPEPNQKVPIKSWGSPSPGEDAANANYANSNVAALGPRRPVVSVDRIGVTPSSYRASGSIPDRSTTEWAARQPDAALRPDMQRVLQRLREMPPFAREREIETGRYRQFSSEEKQILRTAALPSQATIHNLPDSFPQRVSLNSHGPIHDRQSE